MKKLSIILIVSLLQYGQNFNAYANDVGYSVAKSLNPTLIVQDDNIVRGYFNIGNFDILPLFNKPKEQLLCVDRQVIDFNFESCVYGTSFSTLYQVSNRADNEIKQSSNYIDNQSSDVFVEDSHKRSDSTQEGIYQIDVSFEEFKYSIHVLLFVLIAFVAGKLRDSK